jgi:two-component system phosphate regulon sensor histidine kinase PhoR
LTADTNKLWTRWALLVAPLLVGVALAVGGVAAWVVAAVAGVVAAGAAGLLLMPAQTAVEKAQAEAGLAELELDRARERLEQITVELDSVRGVLEASPWPMFATGASGELVLANRAAEEFFQRGPRGLLGRSIEDLVTQGDVITLHAAALSGREATGQVRLQRSDGTRIYQVRAAPVQFGGGRAGAVVSLRDITELATALQLKTDFVANASHELRTPVASIKAAIETLADGAWEDENMRARFTQMIATNAGRLDEMIRDLMELSRLESPEAMVRAEPVSLAELIEDIHEELGSFAVEKKLRLEADVGDGAGELTTDPKLLRMVLKNLIDNAIKFANPETPVRTVARRAGDIVRVQVIDQGAGIPINQQQRVFERFFQVDPARTGFQHRRGTGLGLAIVKHAVKALGGTISVESVWKQGTTMTVELPASGPGSPSSA